MRKLIAAMTVAAVVAASVPSAAFATGRPSSGAGNAYPEFEARLDEAESRLAGIENALSELSSAPSRPAGLFDAETIAAAEEEIAAIKALPNLDVETARLLAMKIDVLSVLAKLDAETIDLIRRKGDAEAALDSARNDALRKSLISVMTETNDADLEPISDGNLNDVEKPLANELPEGFRGDCRNVVEKPDGKDAPRPCSEEILEFENEIDRLSDRLDELEKKIGETSD